MKNQAWLLFFRSFHGCEDNDLGTREKEVHREVFSWIPQPAKSSTSSIPSLAHLVLLPLSPLGEPQRMIFLSFNVPSINPTFRQGEGGGGR